MSFAGFPPGISSTGGDASPPARQGLSWKTELGGMPLATCKLGYARLSTMALGKDRYDSDAAASIVCRLRHRGPAVTQRTGGAHGRKNGPLSQVSAMQHHSAAG